MVIVTVIVIEIVIVLVLVIAIVIVIVVDGACAVLTVDPQLAGGTRKEFDIGNLLCVPYRASRSRKQINLKNTRDLRSL